MTVNVSSPRSTSFTMRCSCPRCCIRCEPTEQPDGCHANSPCPPDPIAQSACLRRFLVPPDVIMLAVGWYLRFGLSHRDVEELLAEPASRSTTSPSTSGCSGSQLPG